MADNQRPWTPQLYLQDNRHRVKPKPGLHNLGRAHPSRWSMTLLPRAAYAWLLLRVCQRGTTRAHALGSPSGARRACATQMGTALEATGIWDRRDFVEGKGVGDDVG